MARHFKNGIEYFSHDTNMKDDTKIKLLKAKYGLTGYAIYNLLLEDIYKDSYYLTLDEDYILLFATDNGLDETLLMEIVKFMISKKLFDETLHNKYSILTSKRIQQNYLRGCTRRKNINLIKEILLINPDEILNDTEKKTTTINYVSINTISLDINDNINTQSKVKETEIQSKEESKSNEIETLSLEKAQAGDFIDSIILIFQECYKHSKGIEYISVGKGSQKYNYKDRNAAGSLLKYIKGKYPDETSEMTLKRFGSLFNKCFTINDTWLSNNMTLDTISNKLNNIILYGQNGNKEPGKNGVSISEHNQGIFSKRSTTVTG
jgi:hypothetical protein